MGTISTQGKNFWIALLLPWFICGIGGLGHLYLGQKKKGIIFLVGSIVLYMIGLGWIFTLLSVIDMWMLKDKIEAGAELGELENGLSFLDGLPGFKE